MKNSFQTATPSMPLHAARAMCPEATAAHAVRGRLAGIALHAPPPDA
jgi:hypothetical protein